MITKKEDLINTYIENDYGELLKSYIWACNRFGVEVRNSVDWYDFRFVIVSSDCGVHFLNTTDYKPTGKQLTLSDLKPHTRTEYEKVTDYFFDLRDEFERGELYFDKDKCTGGIYCSTEQYQKIRDMIDFNQAALNNNIYRKVEKEIDERQEFVDLAIDKIEPFNCDDPSYYSGWFEQLYDAGCRFVGANGEIE